MYEYLDYAVADGIASVLFNRPQKKNAYTPRMGLEIVAACEDHSDFGEQVRETMLLRQFLLGVLALRHVHADAN